MSAATSRLKQLMLLSLSLSACKAVDTNQAPVADAGADQLSPVRRVIDNSGAVVDQFEEVSLDASASRDPDGDYLTRYFWAFDFVPVGSRIDLEALSVNRDDVATTQFTPDQEGIYGITLEVFDGLKLSAKDYVEVLVVRENGSPIARAGGDQNSVAGESVTFDGSMSIDPDADYLSYEWSLVVVPPGSQLTASSLIFPATPNPRITPDVEGVYALQLVVSDGLRQSEPDFVTLTVASGNQSPVPVLTPSTVVTPCFENPVLLDASASFDPEGDAFSFDWEVLEAPYGSLVTRSTLSTPDAAQTRVKLDLYGLYVFTVTLNDGISMPVSGSVSLLHDNGSTQVPPVADPGTNRTVKAQTSCTAEGCPPCDLSLKVDGYDSSDPNGDPLAYFWEVTSGDATLSASSGPELTVFGPALKPPALGRTLTDSAEVRLTVSDCVTSSEPVSFTIYYSCEGI
ncbi:MAG: PKD domain-containing protein [Myxococcota bacterium]